MMPFPPLRRLVLLAIFLLLTAQAALAQQSIVDQFERRLHTLDAMTLPYRLFVPEDYTAEKQYPLVLALHGSGERGDDNEKHIQFHRMATSWADPANQQDYPAFVVAPQAPRGGTWAEDPFDVDGTLLSDELATTLDLLDSLQLEFSIDPDRIYVTGLSMGGIGTWDLIIRVPERFAAAIPMSGGADPSKAPVMSQVSVWNFHGLLDDVVRPIWSQMVIQGMEQDGRAVGYTHCKPDGDCTLMTEEEYADLRTQHQDAFYTAYAGGGHVIWAESYDHPWLFPWVFAQHRKQPDAITLTSPATYQSIQGNLEITWQTRTVIDSVEVWFNPNFSLHWQHLATLGDTGQLGVDTGSLPETAFGRFRTYAVDAEGFVVGMSTSPLVAINNTADGAPFIRLEPTFDEDGEEVVDETFTLRFLAGDAEQSMLEVAVSYSIDGGATFGEIGRLEVPSSQTLQSATVALKNLPNSANAVLHLEVSDGTQTASARTRRFKKATPRTAGGLVTQVLGESGASVTIHFIDENQRTNDRYRLSFRDIGTGLVYDVTNTATTEEVVTGATELDGTEGPLFDGIRLSIQDLPEAEVNLEKSGWNNDDVTVEVGMSAPTVNLGGNNVKLTATPADYQVTFFEEVVGMSSTAYGAPSVPLKFQVQNLTDDQTVEVIFIDLDADANVSPLDFIYVLEPGASSEPDLAWRFSFGGPQDFRQPGAGDTFTLITRKPLSPADVYEFVADPTVAIEAETVPTDAVVLYPNYPNPFSRQTTIRYAVAQPERVTLEVFDLLGRRVAVLLQDVAVSPGEHTVTFEAKALSGGVYFYRMQTGTYTATRRLTVAR